MLVIIDKIFDGLGSISISRYDLYGVGVDIEKFIIMTLMWGFPTKGRGNNINNLLEKDNFDKLHKILYHYICNDISLERLKDDIKSVKGLGLSTITKFTHFLNTTIDGNKAVILDDQIIQALNKGAFEEFDDFRKISYDNAIDYYSRYIQIVKELSVKMDVEPDQIEMFLFMFGKNLSNPKPEKINSKNDIKTYRSNIINTYKKLIKFHNELFSSSINIAMTGDLLDINNSFDTGEIYSFDIEQLKGTNDANLNIIIDLCENLTEAMHILADNNSIKEEELNENNKG